MSLPEFAEQIASSLWSVLTNMTIRGTFILLLLGVVLFVWRGTSAAQRHWVWILGCIAVLTIPFLHPIVPRWEIFVTGTARVETQSPTSLSERETIEKILTLSQQRAGRGNVTTVNTSISTMMSQVGTFLWRATTLPSHKALGSLALTTWLLGTLTALSILIASHRRVRRFIRATELISDPDILALTDRLRQHLKIARNVSLRQRLTTVPLS